MTGFGKGSYKLASDFQRGITLHLVKIYTHISSMIRKALYRISKLWFNLYILVKIWMQILLQTFPAGVECYND